jgi:hypothetical protein
LPFRDAARALLTAWLAPLATSSSVLSAVAVDTATDPCSKLPFFTPTNGKSLGAGDH